jgi:hypothetical protein
MSDNQQYMCTELITTEFMLDHTCIFVMDLPSLNLEQFIQSLRHLKIKIQKIMVASKIGPGK